ncbi:MAG: FeoA family protein [Planctomycetota bacterium]
MTPLVFADRHSDLQVLSIAGGGQVRERLNHLGIARGSIVRLMSDPGSGPVTLAVHGSRIVLGRGVAMKILIAPASPPCV